MRRNRHFVTQPLCQSMKRRPGFFKNLVASESVPTTRPLPIRPLSPNVRLVSPVLELIAREQATLDKNVRNSINRSIDYNPDDRFC